MSLNRTWRATCDRLGCLATLELPSAWSRDRAGESLNDHGWQAAPGIKRTYCPAHNLPDDEWRALIPPLDPAITDRAVEHLAEAMRAARRGARREGWQ